MKAHENFVSENLQNSGSLAIYAGHMNQQFTLADDIDSAKLGADFAATGRVEIRDFLGNEQANILRAHLLDRTDWILVLNAGDGVYEVPRGSLSQMTDGQRKEMDELVIAAGRRGFQYCYESIRVSDDDDVRRQCDTLLDRFICFMSSQPVLALLAKITGNMKPDFADGQATAYSDGHFLTAHDDDVAGKNRHAAYVFGLSPAWRAEWGGLLMFHRDDGNIAEGFVPTMGALRIFSVPALHSVSYVTPLAPEPRLSVPGWLRTRSQDDQPRLYP